jgi:hypothetical protein
MIDPQKSLNQLISCRLGYERARGGIERQKRTPCRWPSIAPRPNAGIFSTGSRTITC